MALGTTAVDLTHRNIDKYAGNAPPYSPYGIVPFSVKVNLNYTDEIDTIDTEIPVFKFPSGAKIPAWILGSLGASYGDGTTNSLDTGTTCKVHITVKEADGTVAFAWEEIAGLSVPAPGDILSTAAGEDGFLDVGGKYLMLGIGAAGTTAAGDKLYVHVFGLVTYNVFTFDKPAS